MDQLAAVQQISASLKNVPELQIYPRDSERDPIEWETAYGICEIAKSGRRINDELLQKLLRTDKEGAGDVLHEIREEVRHILYHIKSSSYFNVVDGSV